MKIKSYILLIVLATNFVPISFAQGYITTAGIRLGNNDQIRTAGITLQQRILKKGTLEAIAQSNFKDNTTIHLLGEYHQNIISRKFNFYMGAGLSGGWEKYSLKGNTEPTTGKTQVKTIGADLIAGVELTMLRWNISLDYKPNFNIYGRESWYQSQVGVSVRAVLWNESDLKKRQKEKARAKKKKEKEQAKKEREESGKSGAENFLHSIFGKDPF
ncbi:MAG TPA: hypothetical protein PKV50_06600 [Prolixibacteraceae bacterium]|nr:hypothetical protein [Prolixibacteraceae bacterium]HQN94413.1 hypothetical protein [Prolixibacteraceae bacterium]HUM89182.1 hypothetical protein [Prolixibacteraceae bacterium]